MDNWALFTIVQEGDTAAANDIIWIFGPHFCTMGGGGKTFLTTSIFLMPSMGFSGVVQGVRGYTHF